MPPAPRAKKSPADPQPDQVADAGSVDLSTMGLHARVARIQGELVNVPKTGHADIKNAQGAALYSYDYVKEEDMMAALKPLLAKYQVACYISIDQVEHDGNMRTVRGSMTIACDAPDRPDGDQAYSIRASASGTDKGEKAIIKATTTVTRYLLQKGWLIETGGLDPEQENIEHVPGERAAARPPQQRGQGTQAKPPGVLNANDRRKLWAAAKDAGLEAAKVREIVMVTCNVLSTAEIPRASLKQLIGDLQGYAANPPAGDKFITEWRAAHPDLAKQLDEKIAGDTDVPADPAPPADDGDDTPFGPVPADDGPFPDEDGYGS